METALKIRNVLFKSFVIAYVVLIASHLFYVTNTNIILKLMEEIYHVTPEDARMAVALAYVFMKIFAFVFFLVPAIAMHWEFAKCKCKEKSDCG